MIQNGSTVVKIVGFYAAVLIVVGVLVANVIAGSRIPLIYFNDGNVKMSAYSDVIKASDGKTYRVQVNDIFEIGKTKMRVAEAYSMDSQFSSISGVSSASRPGSWSHVNVCPSASLRDHNGGCYGSSEAEAVLDELVQAVVVSKNIIGNFEIFWSWEMGTKELINQIKNKK